MPKVNAGLLDKARARLGEAVLDPLLWPELMEGLSRAVGAAGAGLLQSDATTPDIPRTPDVAEMITSYFENGWHTRDIRARAGFPLLLAGARVVADDDVVTPEQIHSSSFYNESLLPFGLQWFAAVGFWAGSSFWALSFQRTRRQGAFLAPEKRILAELSQHLTEVATLSDTVGRIALLGSTSALDLVQQPAVSVDRRGAILQTNAVSEAIWDADIAVSNNRLVLADSWARSALEHLFDQLARPDPAPLRGSEPIVVRRRVRPPVLLRALPVPPAARSPFLGARAILTLTSLEPNPRPAAALLAKTFGLTPAEAKLAAILANGTSLETAAEELGISRETARNRLKSVFLKTATHRQSQLVALLARL